MLEKLFLLLQLQQIINIFALYKNIEDFIFGFKPVM